MGFGTASFLYLNSLSLSHAWVTNQKASVVIGQENFTNSGANYNNGAGGPIEGRGLRVPFGLATDGTKLIVTDFSNNRILIFNQIPTKNGSSADGVIGQPDFQSGSANQGGSANASTLRGPESVILVGKKLLVTDRTNNRVLIYNQLPTTNGAAADVVIGQPDMATVSSGTSATKLSAPTGIYYDESTGKLFIAEIGNDRVLIYHSIPTTNGAAADVVVGQTSFTASGGGTTADKLDNPFGLRVIHGRLFVVENVNDRVLIWNSIPTTNGTSADLVMGQPTLTSTGGNQGLSNPTAFTLDSVNSIFYDGKRLYISEGAANNRLLIYNSLPTQNNHAADIVIGQPNFSSKTANQGGSAGANTISATGESLVIGNKLLVAEQVTNRILIFEDTTNTPKVLFTSSPFLTPEGKLRFTGEVSLSGGEHTVWKVEASVNGGPFGQVTNFESSVTNPGIPDDVKSKFYHDVAPWDNDNSTEDKWKTDYTSLIKDPGYIVRFKAATHNADYGDPIMHFEPFTLVSTNPIKFQVNKKYINILKDTIDHYEVHIRNNEPFDKTQGKQKTMSNDQVPIPEPLLWTKYIDQIPISFGLAREKTDNLLTQLDNTTPEGDNGTYENGNLKVTYTKDSATIQVQAIPSLWNSPLTPGTYLLKAVAVDKYGHPQETLSQELTIPKPYPYQVNPNKPKVQGVSIASPTSSPALASPKPKAKAGPKPSPSTMPAKNNPILNFFNALIH